MPIGVCSSGPLIKSPLFIPIATTPFRRIMIKGCLQTELEQRFKGLFGLRVLLAAGTVKNI